MNKTDTEESRFDFDYWKELYENNPKKFEEERTRRINEEIERRVLLGGISSKTEMRLHGIQWRIDNIHKKYINNPMGGCVRISIMMLDSVFNKDGLLAALNNLLNLIKSNTKPLSDPVRRKDNIILLRKDT